MGRASGSSNTPHWIRNNILDFLRAMICIPRYCNLKGVVRFTELEAHGGYSFCGFAALALLGCEQKIDIRKLLVICAYT